MGAASRSTKPAVRARAVKASKRRAEWRPSCRARNQGVTLPGAPDAAVIRADGCGFSNSSKLIEVIASSDFTPDLLAVLV
jgi:hypothetical protein